MLGTILVVSVVLLVLHDVTLVLLLRVTELLCIRFTIDQTFNSPDNSVDGEVTDIFLGRHPTLMCSHQNQMIYVAKGVSNYEEIIGDLKIRRVTRNLDELVSPEVI
jgi:hypothetical protein